MCWSAPVSLAFAGADLVGIAALLWRRQPWWALAAAPIAAQEVLQFVLWRDLAADPGACSAVNSGATFAVQLILGLVPISWVTLSVFGPHARRPVPLGARVLVAVATVHLVVRTVAEIVGFAAGPQLCTTVGPHHHQVWGDPLNAYGDAIWLMVIPGAFYFGLPTIGVAAFLRPRRRAAAVLAVAGTTALLAMVFRPGEFGSIWCWSCAALIGLGLVPERA